MKTRTRYGLAFSALRLSSAVLATAVVVGSMTGSVQANEPDPETLLRVEQLQETLADVADQVRPSVVAIRSYRRPEATKEEQAARRREDGEEQPALTQLIPAVGSGVIISEDGLILTNEHVIHNAEPEGIECILHTGERYVSAGLTSDPRSDLAVLRIDAEGLKPAVLGDVSRVRQGHFAIVLGNPFGTAADAGGMPAMSFGIISSLGQDLTDKLDPQRYYGNLIQTDARINPGNSGGPLVNLHGEVIGINTAISSRSGGNEGVGYAIPLSDRTKELITRLSHGEEIAYGYLGVRLDRTPAGELPAHIAIGGALVTSVEKGTPASEAGLLTGDVVLRFAGTGVKSPDDLIRCVGAAQVGTTVKMLVMRGQERVSLDVIVGRRPDVLRGINFEPDIHWRGMRLTQLGEESRTRLGLPAGRAGVAIMAVDAGGPAEQSGLRAADVIEQVNDERIVGLRQLRRMLPHLAKQVRVVVRRGEDEQRATLEP